MTGWKAGDVLYCGDSLFADLVDAHRANGWHTAAIINELEDEISVIESQEHSDMLLKSSTLEELLRLIQNEVFRLPPLFHDGGILERLPQRTAADDKLIDAIEHMLKEVKDEMRVCFNPQFGSVFRTKHGMTMFASSLYRHSDLYTSKLENLNAHGARFETHFSTLVECYLHWYWDSQCCWRCHLSKRVIGSICMPLGCPLSYRRYHESCCNTEGIRTSECEGFIRLRRGLCHMR
jgi:hypothetical protein